MTNPPIHPALERAIAARGYATLTPVQAAVIAADAGRDLLVSAQTGSGKTVAFGLAAGAALLGAEERLGPAGAPLALIIAPTRELALQVQRELAWLYAETGARVVTCVGGMDPKAEARQLGYGAHIVVGTPGRLRDHLERGRLDFSSLKAVVLDEADEMLDLGFREDLEFILDATPESRQTLLFSATLPREIEQMAQRYQRDAQRIETLKRNEQHADIEYRAFRVVPGDTEHAVVNVLRLYEAKAAIVFCATREAVKRFSARLAERGFSAVALSGELSQNERSHALQALRDGRARVLVATDVAARGLDLPALELVIHAELPNDAETLLHRSGRTGRAGNKGLSVLVVPFNRRRKAETLIGGAKLKVTWGAAPSAEEIRARDQERFLADASFTDPAADDETALVGALQAARSADEIALALVRLNRGRLPAPEDLAEDTGPPPRREFGSDRFAKRGERRPREGGQRTFEPRPFERRDDAGAPRGVRDHGREMVWFRVDIGRERNADPRWLLPLICRAGNVTKADVGAIKIFDRDTRFQVAAEAADAFADAARGMKPNEGRISRLADREPQEARRAEHVQGAERAHAAEPSSAVETGSREQNSDAAGREARPAKAWVKREHGTRPDGPKKPWRERNAADGASSRAQSPDTPRDGADGAKKWAKRDSGARPDGPKKPWRARTSTDAASGERNSDAPGNGAPGRKPWVKRESGAGSDAPRKPWRERREGEGGHAGGAEKWKPRGPRADGDGARPFRHRGKDRPAPQGHDGGGRKAPGAGRPTSKYAHKKKHRGAPPAKP